MSKGLARVFKSMAWLAVVAGLAVGCSSSKDKADTQTTSARKTQYGDAVNKALEVAVVLSNPKEGLDPVCAMALSEEPVTVTLDNGKTYGFCSKNCSEAFKMDPDKYLTVAANDHDGDDHSGHDH